MTQRRVCSGCGYDGLVQFLDLGLSPIADAYTDTFEEISKTYPLQVAVCTGCRLVQLLEVVDAETLFGTGYSFYSSASPPLSRYHKKYADIVLGQYGQLAKRLVVEIGCNDGDMLRHFAEAKCPHVGVDPASGPVSVARERGVTVRDQAFTTSVAEDIHNTYGSAGIVVANHVLAHVEDVSDVLHGVSILLGQDDGVAFIEVQYVQDLIVNNAFDLVYHEHRNFFSLTSLENAARRWGLKVIHAELTQRQGGSLRVTLSRNGALQSDRSVRDIRDSEWWLNAGLGAYEGMQGRVERIRRRLWDTLTPWIDEGLVLAGYGAPAKATTLLNFCDIDANILSYVVDSTPAKQGRFIPGTGIPIIAPFTWDIERDLPNAYLLLAWNYANEIITNNSPGFGERGGRWIIPIPAPVVL